LEFLVREMGRGQSEPYEVTSFGIKAEGLRNTNILIDNIDVIEVGDIKIIVPTP